MIKELGGEYRWCKISENLWDCKLINRIDKWCNFKFTHVLLSTTVIALGFRDWITIIECECESVFYTQGFYQLIIILLKNNE